MSYPTPIAADDAALLRRYAHSGDASAFAELVGRYADFVYATARRVTGSAAAAEDVAQDCFLRLAQRSREIRGSVAAWLHRATVNRSLEYRRSELARRRRETAATPRAGEGDGENGSESAHLVAMVDEAMAQLPEELRVAVTEHFLGGRSQVELAAALGVSQPTVSRRIEKGLAELRDRLRRDGAVPAVAMLVLLLATLPQLAAPAGVRSAATKIGLSGVGASVATASASSAAVGAAGGSALLLTAATIIGVAGCVVGAALYLRSPATPGVPTGAAAKSSATTTTSVIRSVLSDDDDDDADDDDDDDGAVSAKPAPAGAVRAAAATRPGP
jgi:RNA polymerase sigma-70 factor (ECF subfamily)